MLYFLFREERMADTESILKEAMALSPDQKAELIDKLLSSIDKTYEEIEALWAKEAEERIDAYDKGEMKSISLKKY
jgi:putative addiction module component (TIGR02574 family)